MSELHKPLPEEQIQDASLLILMDEYAQADGQKLLTNFKASGMTMPVSLDRVCQLQFDQYRRKSEKSTLLRNTVYRVAKIAAVLVLVCSLSANLILSVEAIRVPCLNFFIRITDYFTEISFSDEQSTYDSDVLPFSPPDGYTVIVQKHNYDDFSKIRPDSILFYGFRKDDGSMLSIESLPAEGSISLDTEDSETVSFYMNGMKAIHIIKSNGEQSIVWFDASHKRIYNAFCSNMDKDEFLTYLMILSIDLTNNELYES